MPTGPETTLSLATVFYPRMVTKRKGWHGTGICMLIKVFPAIAPSRLLTASSPSRCVLGRHGGAHHQTPDKEMSYSTYWRPKGKVVKTPCPRNPNQSPRLGNEEALSPPISNSYLCLRSSETSSTTPARPPRLTSST